MAGGGVAPAAIKPGGPIRHTGDFARIDWSYPGLLEEFLEAVLRLEPHRQSHRSVMLCWSEIADSIIDAGYKFAFTYDGMYVWCGDDEYVVISDVWGTI